MSTVTDLETLVVPFAALPAVWTVAEMQERLGDISAERILIIPSPGTATVEDVERVRNSTGRICELVDGTLVQKTVGWYESHLAVILSHLIQGFLDNNNLGMVLGPDGTLEILADTVRAADVSFIRWEKFPGGKLPNEPIPPLVPNLAAEVLSKSSTPAEMKRKRHEYFEAGVELVWLIDPVTRTATVYASPEVPTFIDRDGVLSGGGILPGFTLSLAELFARAEPPATNG